MCFQCWRLLCLCCQKNVVIVASHWAFYGFMMCLFPVLVEVWPLCSWCDHWDLIRLLLKSLFLPLFWLHSFHGQVVVTKRNESKKDFVQSQRLQRPSRCLCTGVPIHLISIYDPLELPAWAWDGLNLCFCLRCFSSFFLEITGGIINPSIRTPEWAAKVRSPDLWIRQSHQSVCPSSSTGVAGKKWIHAPSLRFGRIFNLRFSPIPTTCLSERGSCVGRGWCWADLRPVCNTSWLVNDASLRKWRHLMEAVRGKWHVVTELEFHQVVWFVWWLRGPLVWVSKMYSGEVAVSPTDNFRKHSVFISVFFHKNGAILERSPMTGRGNQRCSAMLRVRFGLQFWLLFGVLFSLLFECTIKCKTSPSDSNMLCAVFAGIVYNFLPTVIGTSIRPNQKHTFIWEKNILTIRPVKVHGRWLAEIILLLRSKPQEVQVGSVDCRFPHSFWQGGEFWNERWRSALYCRFYGNHESNSLNVLCCEVLKKLLEIFADHFTRFSVFLFRDAWCEKTDIVDTSSLYNIHIWLLPWNWPELVPIYRKNMLYFIRYSIRYSTFHHMKSVRLAWAQMILASTPLRNPMWAESDAWCEMGQPTFATLKNLDQEWTPIYLYPSSLPFSRNR